jgi:putative lipoprotein
VIGEQVIQEAVTQVPIPFEVTFDPAEIDARMTYSVRATIMLDGKLIMTSTQAYPVITRDAPRYGVEIQLESVGN